MTINTVNHALGDFSNISQKMRNKFGQFMAQAEKIRAYGAEKISQVGDFFTRLRDRINNNPSDPNIYHIDNKSGNDICLLDSEYYYINR